MFIETIQNTSETIQKAVLTAQETAFKQFNNAIWPAFKAVEGDGYADIQKQWMDTFKNANPFAFQQKMAEAFSSFTK